MSTVGNWKKLEGWEKMNEKEDPESLNSADVILATVSGKSTDLEKKTLSLSQLRPVLQT